MVSLPGPAIFINASLAFLSSSSRSSLSAVSMDSSSLSPSFVLSASLEYHLINACFSIEPVFLGSTSKSCLDSSSP